MNYDATFLLAFFFGSLGAHRFYNKQYGTGFLMFITLGGFGLWALIDLILIVANGYKVNGVTVMRETSFFKTAVHYVAAGITALQYFMILIFSIAIIAMAGVFASEIENTSNLINSVSDTTIQEISENGGLNEEQMESAKSFIESGSFSRAQVIDMLKFQGVSEADAEIGVDSLNVDWNEQALKAVDDVTLFREPSDEEIRDNLTLNKFTPEQIDYAIANKNAN